MKVEAAAEIISLSVEDYSLVLQRMADNGLSGGVIYDALLARAAEKAGAEQLLTLNESDFRRVWPEGTSILISP